MKTLVVIALLAVMITASAEENTKKTGELSDFYIDQSISGCTAGIFKDENPAEDRQKKKKAGIEVLATKSVVNVVTAADINELSRAERVEYYNTVRRILGALATDE